MSKLFTGLPIRLFEAHFLISDTQNLIAQNTDEERDLRTPGIFFEHNYYSMLLVAFIHCGVIHGLTSLGISAVDSDTCANNHTHTLHATRLHTHTTHQASHNYPK